MIDDFSYRRFFSLSCWGIYMHEYTSARCATYNHISHHRRRSLSLNYSPHGPRYGKGSFSLARMKSILSDDVPMSLLVRRFCFSRRYILGVFQISNSTTYNYNLFDRSMAFAIIGVGARTRIITSSTALPLTPNPCKFI